jgi:RNA recognition motif-containing protein
VTTVTRPLKRKKSLTQMDGMSSVVYVGHIPHGFYEDQMRGFFSQFGEIDRLRLSRSKKTGGSKGYAFIEFKDAADAKIVAEAMVIVGCVHCSCFVLILFVPCVKGQVFALWKTVGGKTPSEF